jgi:mono/diheme cytochrome c family protein
VTRQAAVLLLIAACAAGAEGDAARGRELFRSCSGCHNTASDERKAGPSLRTLFGKVTLRNGKHVEEENVREIILDGWNGMPSFRYSFRPAEIDDLMAYLRTLTGKPPEPDIAPGARYFRAYCLRCHNPDSRTSAGLDFRGRFKPENVPAIEDGHAGAPALKDWLGEKERGILFEYLKTY